MYACISKGVFSTLIDEECVATDYADPPMSHMWSQVPSFCIVGIMIYLQCYLINHSGQCKMAKHFGEIIVDGNMYKHTVVDPEGLSKTLHQPQYSHSLQDKASEFVH